MGYAGPEGGRRAGLLGEGLMQSTALRWPAYRDGLVEAGHDPKTGRMVGGFQAFVTDDPERDWPMVAEHLAHRAGTYARFRAESGEPLEVPDPEVLRAQSPAGPSDYFVIGTPETVAAAILERAGDAPVETVSLFASVSGMDEEVVARHVQMVFTELAPILAAVGSEP